MTNKKVKCELVALAFMAALLATVTLVPLKNAEAQNATSHKLGEHLSNVQQKMTEHPNEMRKMLHWLNMIGAFDFDAKGVMKPNFSAIKAKAKSNAISDLEKQIESRSGQYQKGKAATDHEHRDDNSRANLDAMRGFLG